MWCLPDSLITEKAAGMPTPHYRDKYSITGSRGDKWRLWCYVTKCTNDEWCCITGWGRGNKKRDKREVVDVCGNPDHHEGRRKRNKAGMIQFYYFITTSSSSHFWRKESFTPSSLMTEWWQWEVLHYNDLKKMVLLQDGGSSDHTVATCCYCYCLSAL